MALVYLVSLEIANGTDFGLMGEKNLSLVGESRGGDRKKYTFLITCVTIKFERFNNLLFMGEKMSTNTIEKIEDNSTEITNLLLVDGNLLENPFFFLGRGKRPTHIKHEFMYESKNNGEILGKRSIEFKNIDGVPGLLEMDTLYALIALWADQRYKGNSINFTLYELCKKLGLPHNIKNRENLKKALSCLASTVYTTKYAVYIGGNYTRTTEFTFIERDIFEYKETEVGEFHKDKIREANRVVFADYLVQNLRKFTWKIDFKKYLSLNQGTQRRLYVHLQKRPGPKYEVGVKKLADKIPLQGPLFKIRENLKENLPPLVEKGIVLTWDFSKDKRKILFRFPTNQQYLPGFEDINLELLAELIKPERGITEKKARELLQNYPEEQIKKQIRHFDWKKEQKNGEIGAGFLIRAIEEKWFLPETLEEKIQREEALYEEEELKKQMETQKKRIEKEKWDLLDFAEKRDLFVKEFDGVAYLWERFSFIEKERQHLSNTLLQEAKKGKSKQELEEIYKETLKRIQSQVKKIKEEEALKEKERKKYFIIYFEKYKMPIYNKFYRQLEFAEKERLREEAKHLYLQQMGLPLDKDVSLVEYQDVLEKFIDEKAGIISFEKWLETYKKEKELEKILIQ